MDAQKIQQAYLRALYTGVVDQPTNEEESFLHAHLSPERLLIEHAARVRNLRAVLHDDMHVLSKTLNKADLLPYVHRYVLSEQFWMHRGRTLIEDFCLHFVEQSPAPTLHKVLARIEGIHSGLSAAPRSRTPWPAHAKWNEGDDICEGFASPLNLSFHRLFDKPSDYQPVSQEVNCILRRSGKSIHVKFHNAQSCK